MTNGLPWRYIFKCEYGYSVFAMNVSILKKSKKCSSLKNKLESRFCRNFFFPMMGEFMGQKQSAMIYEISNIDVTTS